MSNISKLSRAGRAVGEEAVECAQSFRQPDGQAELIA
jgi:hypothetical protein